MKKLNVICLLALSLCLFGCGKEVTPETPIVVEGEAGQTDGGVEVVDFDDFGTVSDDADAEVVDEVEEEVREGMYRSELTNEWIEEEYRDQRPIAVMVDNESTALPHYGINSADVVYELMNSTANDRITRLMVVKKDWQNITQFGSVRSVRPTNFFLAAEWNAILIHDGGPFYINDYVARDYTNNLSGGFARFSNGKATEFTEYVTYEDYYNPTKGQTYDGLQKRIDKAGYSTTYNSYYPGPHFNFSNTEIDLSGEANVKAATTVELPYKHNGSKLFYNEQTKTYDYYEYGAYHTDPLDDNNVTSFKNVIITSNRFFQYDDHGYMIYYTIEDGEGWYLTNGQAIPITWSKESETAITEYKNKATGEPITLNTGMTYITLCPSDQWSNLVIK